MRRTLTVTLMIVVLAAALLVSGCTLFKNPIDDANAAISEANVHFRAYQESNDKLAKLNTDLRALEVTPETAPQALTLISELKAESAVQKTELDAGIKAMAKVKTFDVDATFKKYADLEIAAVDARIAVIDEGVKLYVEMERMYTAIRDDKASELLTNEVLANIETISARITELDALAVKATQAANDAFDKTSQVK
jgi:predicted negative regulator of RcsB-dependent stress response